MVSASLGKPCDLCGDAGNEDLVATCSLCGTGRHVYCMRIVLMEVPNVWFCEECRPNNNAVSPKYCKNDELSKVTSEPEIIHRDATCFDNSIRVGEFKRQKIVKSGKVKLITTEEAIMLTSGANKMDSPLRKPYGKISCSSTRMPSMSKKTPPRPKIASIKVLSSKFEPNPTCKPSQLLSPPKHFSVPHGAQASKELKEATTPVAHVKKSFTREQADEAPKFAKERTTSDTKVQKVTDKDLRFSSVSMHGLPIKKSGKKNPSYSFVTEATTAVAHAKKSFSREQADDAPKLANERTTSDSKVQKVADKDLRVSSASMQGQPIKKSGGYSCTDGEISKTMVEEKNLLSNQQTLQNYIPNLPRTEATWKGTLEILSNAMPGKLYDGFVAHPPSRVHPKAYKFSKLMPSVLQFKLLPRCNIWTDIFEDNYPDGDDIALYIIPEDFERSLQHYICLLEAMEIHDSVMCSYMSGGVEFLIFTSKLLHVDFQKSCTKSFLWGVFRCVKAKAITEEQNEVVPLLAYDLHNRENYEVDMEMDNEENEVDMEIDMIGGKDV